MRTRFQFSNLCGTVYRQGNLVFLPDGKSLLSPVGNRVTVFDLTGNKSFTLPVETKTSIRRMALAPNGVLLLVVDEGGRAYMINLRKRVLLHVLNLKQRNVKDIQFSPDGRFFSVTHEKQIHIWRAPNPSTIGFAPFVFYRKFSGHYDDVVSVQWSPDSRFLVTTAKDTIVRVYSLDKHPTFTATALTGHRDVVVAAWFTGDNEILSVSQDGAAFRWQIQLEPAPAPRSDDSDVEEQATVPRKFECIDRQFFKQESRVSSAAYHARSGLLLVGFRSGVFGIWEMPHFTNIHTISVSQQRVDAVSINSTGEWVAIACAKLGQLLVWEWQSESYVMKQQSHYNTMKCLAYSQDGQYVATGGEDGKVKVWNVRSGFCFVTFSEHTAAVTALEFTKNGQVLVSSSLDGTVRAFDLIRYRNFRTFLSPTLNQFSSLAVDTAGDIVCAGTMDSFEIYVWSMQTGKVLDVLPGHDGPVSTLRFYPNSNILVSGSWDFSIRVWDLVSRDRFTETMRNTSEVLSLAVHPGGQRVAAVLANGDIALWDTNDARQLGAIAGRRDFTGGRHSDDRVSVENLAAKRNFTSVSFSTDGSCVLAGGNSKYVCLFDVDSRVLLQKFEISKNQSYEGVLDQLNSRNMTDAGPIDALDVTDDSDNDDGPRNAIPLPGVRNGDLSKRTTRPEVRVAALQFSPTGRAWAAAATEGLLVYSLDDTVHFDPFELDIDITPQAALKKLAMGETSSALLMALKLNEPALISQCLRAVPVEDVSLFARQVPIRLLEPLLRAAIRELESSQRFEVNLRWAVALLEEQQTILSQSSEGFLPVLRSLRKEIARAQSLLAKMCNDNRYTIDYLLSIADTTKSIDAMVLG